MADLDRIMRHAVDVCIPEFEQRRREANKEAESYLLPADILARRSGWFCGTSLSAWIAVAELAGLRAVEARPIGVFSWDLQCRMIDHAGTPEDLAVIEALEAAVQQGEILRVDCCAGSEVKHHMATGHYPEMPDWRPYWIDDPRLIDILSEDPRAEIPVFARPWRTDFATVPGSEGGTYSVEWRVFFGGRTDDGAVSAYYPQAPLDDRWTETAAVAAELAGRMVEVMHTAEMQPWLPNYREAPPGLHCTLDFVTLATGELLFLEGGPPHLESWGAHPCCFEGRRPNGITLRREPPESLTDG